MLLLLIDKKFLEVLPLLNQAGLLVDNWTGSQHQKEYLKVYFLVLQVCHYLMAGQVKSVKPCLKQLQQSIQTIMMPSWPSDDVVSGTNVGDMFIWMPKEHLYVLVYLVTVMHSMQAGYMDKAQKYTEKALMQIEKLKIVDNKPILSVFQLMLLEHIVMCRLVMGNKTLALQEMAQACVLCQSQPRLLQSHRPQLHTLLGLYAMSMNCMEAAEAQFMAALSMDKNNATGYQYNNNGRLFTNNSRFQYVIVTSWLLTNQNKIHRSNQQLFLIPVLSQERDLWTFANLNLGIVYLRGKREMEFANLLERINPDTLPSHSHSLRAAAYYVQGLQSFFQARYNEAKRYLRETLKMANAEDSNRLTSCTLVLLGHIFLSLGNSQESMNMVTPAMQLASKIPDVHVQLWASAILKDLYRMCGDPARENEAYQMHCNFSQMLLKDHFQSSQMAEHNLIFWLEGSFPLLATNPPSTSTQLI
ncbi:mau2 chromatid cohesion factor [Homalodisca vitripennis]|nr:mau2 chromatid cohesion factor [Homalodisca vitripennis]